MQKFLEHFAGIADALETVGAWDDHDGMFYDRIVLPDGDAVPVRVRSMVAMIPLLAVAVVNEQAIDRVVGDTTRGSPTTCGTMGWAAPRT